jgi:hypothetical protein
VIERVHEQQTLSIVVEEKDNQLKTLGGRIDETKTELEKGSLKKQESLKLLRKQSLSHEDLAPGEADSWIMSKITPFSMTVTMQMRPFCS